MLLLNSLSQPLKDQSIYNSSVHLKNLLRDSLSTYCIVWNNVMLACLCFYALLRRREGILLAVGLFVCPSVTFSSPINKNSRTPRPTFLKLLSRGLWFWGHWVKGHRVKCVKTVSDCLSNNFPKVSSSYICATYFELTYPVFQNICDKKIFIEGSMFYKHLLFVRE